MCITGRWRDTPQPYLTARDVLAVAIADEEKPPNTLIDYLFVEKEPQTVVGKTTSPFNGTATTYRMKKP